MTQQGLRGATVRVMVGLAVAAFVGAAALLAIGPNRTSDWKASDCGAPIKWLTGHEEDRGTLDLWVTESVIKEPEPPSCRSLVWRQIHWAAGLGATGLGLVVAAIVVTRTRPRPGATVRLIAI